MSVLIVCFICHTKYRRVKFIRQYELETKVFFHYSTFMNLSDISKKISLLQKGLSWKYCLAFWIPLLLLARPLFYAVYSPKWIVCWFTDFNWVLPYGGGFGSTRDVIASNIIRATIMFVPTYFSLIIMHAISKKNSIIEKLVYYLFSKRQCITDGRCF